MPLLYLQNFLAVNQEKKSPLFYYISIIIYSVPFSAWCVLLIASHDNSIAIREAARPEKLLLFDLEQHQDHKEGEGRGLFDKKEIKSASLRCFLRS